MEQELFEGLHKNRRWALKAVCQENLCRSWYLSYQLAGDAAGAASLLLSAWREALAALKNAKEAPWGRTFKGCFPKRFWPSTSRASSPIPALRTCPRPRRGRATSIWWGR